MDVINARWLLIVIASNIYQALWWVTFVIDKKIMIFPIIITLICFIFFISFLIIMATEKLQ